MKIFIEPEAMKKDYAASPAWLKALMDAWADGLNFYLTRHPEVQPRVITHFEPWMALSFTEDIIGGDIAMINLARLRDFYGGGTTTAIVENEEQGFIRERTRSNVIAIAESNSLDKHSYFNIIL